MNKLILIGNGFDLAHGLKTKYNDFMLWYFQNALKVLIEKGKYSDPLFEISFDGILLRGIDDRTSTIIAFKEFLKEEEGHIKYRFKCALFDILFKKTSEPKWVDIESEYYDYLKKLYKQLEDHDFNILGNIERQVNALNSDFEFIKIKLHEYLNTVESVKIKPIPYIVEHFKNHFSSVPNTQSFLMFLNFNYTSTIEIYLQYIKHKQYNINYIHGKLNDDRNRIIFGYGDEIDSYYQKIENINNNAFLKNFKSFGYLLTSNYQDFSSFLDNNTFEVYIFGHSCGLSDRTMLNKIVEHGNCHRIKIFYYKRSSSENDFIEKTYELSRHFSLNNKTRMRDIIEPFPKSKPLVEC